MIVFGLSMFFLGLLLLIATIIFGFFKGLYSFIKSIVELIGFLIYAIFDYIFITRKDKKTGYYQKQIMRIHREEESQERKAEQSRKEVIVGAMNFVTKMRVQYPLADESVFQEAVSELPRDTCRKTLSDYEKMIKESHNYNMQNNPISSSNGKTYTLADLDDLTPIEMRIEKPITMNLYKIGQEYILWVFNSQTNENTLLQTEDYFLMASYMITILELQQNLRKLKESVRSIQLENIFNVKKDSINDNYIVNKRF